MFTALRNSPVLNSPRSNDKKTKRGINFFFVVVVFVSILILGIFEEAFTRISCHILHWGYQKSRQDYVDVLKTADVAVSTAEHEFFGVSM